MAPHLKVTYFNMKARAEPIRLALAIGDIPFEDERLTREQFAELKETYPFGQLPILTIDHKTVIAQQHAILRYVGRFAGLYPEDPIEQAKVDQFLGFAEDINFAVGKTLHTTDPTLKKSQREELSSKTLPKLFGYLERSASQTATGYLVGSKLTVADIVLYCFDGWLRMGVLDHVSPTILDGFPTLMKIVENVRGNEKVKAWNEAH
ncbi:hypothetical protein HK097_003946 [Rhizophlyctis rosea]|uniref:Glutathione S-transferase n=1 Tax=Rhizophlyctis rosea TaxID=64517 RepID=A0AAD5SFR1_9FUNG|nr:hypothetical protein HK097_003946 [Rhizophlyctis rosea]